ncbi:Electron transfer flavoprotein alpha-subunit [Boothiomyces sp. JEL0838]|nr:Electron transfer flavoprotein alpha-subunit [Boothiomyces sp. JEL0838]
MFKRQLSVIGRRSVSTLLVIEQSQGTPLASNLHALSAATKLGFPVTALVAGSAAHVEAAAKVVAGYPGVTKVLTAKNDVFDHGLAEPHADLISASAKGHSHIVTAHSAYGKNVFPRVGALLDVSPIPDVTEIISADTFKRPIYAGNAIATVKSKDATKVITIRPTAFAPSASTGGSAAVEDTTATGAALSKWVSEEIVKSDRPKLEAAKVVVSGGRGLKSAENFKLMYDLADKLGAAVGASRAACDAGYAPHDLQVGQTGKIVAPEAYIAIAVSGAIQHLAGMKDSKLIAAINTDPEAPIFQVADYGLVADLFEAVPEMIKKL